MNKVSLDTFELDGDHYILVVDRFSRYPFVRVTKSLTLAICEVLHGCFFDYGFLWFLKSDNGPQFRQQFSEFSLSHDIQHKHLLQQAPVVIARRRLLSNHRKIYCGKLAATRNNLTQLSLYWNLIQGIMGSVRYLVSLTRPAWLSVKCSR